MFERLPLADFGNRIPQLSFEIMRPVGRLEQMVRAVTLIPGTTEFGYEPDRRAVSGPGSRRRRTAMWRMRSDVSGRARRFAGRLPESRTRRHGGGMVRNRSARGHCTRCPGSTTRQTDDRRDWSVDGLRSSRPSGVDRRVAVPHSAARRPMTASDLIHELKARGLKVTLYPFVMMDIAAGNALPDPWTGAASQPAFSLARTHHLRSGAGPARLSGRHRDGRDADRRFLRRRRWIYRRMVLHYASLAATAGGVDAFLIGSELSADARALRVGRYPAVNQLVTLAADVKAIVGAARSSPMARTGPNMVAHVVDARLGSAFSARSAVGVGGDRCGRHRLLRAAGRLARRWESRRQTDR